MYFQSLPLLRDSWMTRGPRTILNGSLFPLPKRHQSSRFFQHWPLARGGPRRGTAPRRMLCLDLERVRVRIHGRHLQMASSENSNLLSTIHIIQINKAINIHKLWTVACTISHAGQTVSQGKLAGILRNVERLMNIPRTLTLPAHALLSHHFCHSQKG